ncbi:ATP-binding protein [Sphingobacterium faecale]|uniref:histidine kinase n=1 Tax=Sphingobacterium faecale TaxID=2803775 RepID=A0ABS1R169_9SPHI|nr:ATP-binding protein [Sphingobacterium faecale]MBL1408408.1 response regulator [Sphingobacterium faecale]
MILIVDDKPENIFSLRSLLESKGFQVDTALSGEEALKNVLKKDYALIILDVQMPGMDGFEVAETLAGYSKTKEIPIIFLSAVNTDKKFITKGYASGGIDYITKPVDPDILMLKVKTFYRLYEQTLALNEVKKRLQQEVESRKQAQEELKIKVDFLHMVLETIPQIAFTVDSNGQITFVNENWFKYSKSPVDFPEVHPEDTLINILFETHIESGEPFEAEIRIRNVIDKTYHFHLLRIIPLKEGDMVSSWVGTFTDIEDQKQVENKKDEFLSIASHELKTPLTSIKAYIQLLERLVKQEGNVSTYIHRAQDQVIKLESLIADLLDISKIENGKLKVNFVSFDLENLIGNAIDTILHTHEHLDMVIEREGEPLSVEVNADAIRIEQVLINFLTNAIKYSPGSEKVIVQTGINDGQAFIKVKDFGIGIPKNKQEYVFSKFYRVEESSVKFQGLGIGLYICAEIIKQHHGTYGVESEEGKGTTFYFSIPLN